MTHVSYALKDVYKDGTTLEKFIGKVATVGAYEKSEDGEDVPVATSVGVVTAIQVSEASNGRYFEVVFVKDVDRPMSTDGLESLYLMISGDV